jgi:hypothetical protein
MNGIADTIGRAACLAVHAIVPPCNTGASVVPVGYATLVIVVVLGGVLAFLHQR